MIGFLINLMEIQLFSNNVQISRNHLQVACSSIYGDGSYPIQNCNDGDLNTMCSSGVVSGYFPIDDPNSTITITSPVVFDKVLVYNRVSCCKERIEGATITATVNRQSMSTTFPATPPDYIFTFLFVSVYFRTVICSSQRLL